jgi:hypothetical protein
MVACLSVMNMLTILSAVRPLRFLKMAGTRRSFYQRELPSPPCTSLQVSCHGDMVAYEIDPRLSILEPRWSSIVPACLAVWSFKVLLSAHQSGKALIPSAIWW